MDLIAILMLDNNTESFFVCVYAAKHVFEKIDIFPCHRYSNILTEIIIPPLSAIACTQPDISVVRTITDTNEYNSYCKLQDGGK